MFRIQKSSIQGKGAFATKTIRKGTRIVEYTGERITHEEASARYDDEAMSRHHTFLFSIDDETCIDAKVGGNDARFINHSCEPNCEAIDEDGRIFIVALRTLREGDELLYDYRYIIEGEIDDETLARYRCRCGAPSCRGTILSLEWNKKKGAKAPKPKPKAKTKVKRAGTREASATA